MREARRAGIQARGESRCRQPQIGAGIGNKIEGADLKQQATEEPRE